MKVYATMESIGSYIPQDCISNQDFERVLDTSDEWILKRTGIKTRHFAKVDEKASDMAYMAAKEAIQRANISKQSIDLVLVACMSGDYLQMPSVACLLSAKLGIEGKPAFDISAACSGFIYVLSVAKSYIESGAAKKILIVGVDKISSILDFSDRSTSVLFGDGAGAAIIGTTNDISESILDVKIGADGKYADLLDTTRVDLSVNAPRPNASNSALINTSNNNINVCLHMKGNEIFKIAVKTLAKSVKEIMITNNIAPKDINFFVPHQANLRIIEAVGNMLDFKPEQIVITVQKYGNTSAASIPTAIADIYNEGRLKKHDLMLLDAFGGGLTWGSALVYFAGK